MAVFKTLTKRSDFLRVQRNNQKYVTSCMVLQIAPNHGSSQLHTRVGFTASKKIGNATKRNFAKRRMRALVALQRDALVESADYVLIARRAMLIKKFSEIESEIISALHSLNKRFSLQKADTVPNRIN